MGLSLVPFRRRQPEIVERSVDPIVSLEQWAEMFQFGYQGVNYSLPVSQQEEIAADFTGLTRQAYKSNGVVFACMLVRMLLFSEARFTFRERRNGRPGNLFGDSALAALEVPWRGATTSDLLKRMIQHADLAGNAFVTSRYGGARVMRPTWTTIILGSDANPEVDGWDIEAEPVGYMYKPGGQGSGREPVFFLPEEVAHFAPIPDPEASFRGMSWLTPIVREVMADKAMTEHKLSFMTNGATPQMVVKLDVPDLEKFKQWQELYKNNHEGAHNAYKTLFLGAGADATVVGSDLKQLDFKVSQGAGETRIAANAGVPPVLVGLSEGLASATYSNYLHARRRFGDMTMRPLWRDCSGSLAVIVPSPPGSELWTDDRDIPALQEDQKDAAEIQSINAAAMSSLITSGYKPDSVTDAVTAGDLTRLVHTGLVSVQLLPMTPPAAPAAPAAPPAAVNGNGKRSDDLLGELVRLAERNRKPVEIHNHLPEHTTTVEPTQVEIHNHIPEQEPARVDIHEGAFRSETTVEPAQVRVPVTVEAAEPQHITVEAARAPDVNVTVEPAEVRVEAPNVTVEAPEPSHITVEAARAPDVHVNVEPSPVTVEAAPAPEVHVHVPEPPRPRNARARREEDGSLTVSYDDEETPDAGSEE